MDAKERGDLLIELNTNMGHVLNALEKMPCEAREKRIGKLENRQTRTEEKVDNHNKFIWGTVITSIGSVIGLVFIGIKMIFSSAFMIKP